MNTVSAEENKCKNSYFINLKKHVHKRGSGAAEAACVVTIYGNNDNTYDGESGCGSRCVQAGR